MNTLLLTRWHAPVIAVLGAVTLYHATLLGKGAFAWPDEFLYKYALDGVCHLTRCDVAGYCRSISDWGVRPFEGIIRTGPAAVQQWLWTTQGLPYANPASALIPTAMNVPIWTLLGIAFYRLSLRFFEGNRLVAAFATAAYAALTSSNVFIRHVIPYDSALLLMLCSLLYAIRIDYEKNRPLFTPRVLLAAVIVTVATAVYPLAFLISRSTALPFASIGVAATYCGLWLFARGTDWNTTKQCVLAGTLGGLGIATYPAYYLFPVATAAIIAFGGTACHTISFTGRGLRAAATYCLSVYGVMWLFEVIARIGGHSFFAGAYRLSTTITQGSFEEGYIFLPRFFSEVEGAFGVLLLLLAGAYALSFVSRIVQHGEMQPSEKLLGRCVIFMSAAYLYHATQSTVLHRMVFTGRYIHHYIPFVVWMAVAAIYHCRWQAMRACAYFMTATAALLGVIHFDREYRPLDYPLNVLYDYRLDIRKLAPASAIFEAETLPTLYGADVLFPETTLTAGNGKPVIARFHDDAVVVNCGFFTPFFSVNKVDTFTPDRALRPVYSGRHFLTFRSSRFEGFPVLQRLRLATDGFHIRLYTNRREAAAVSATTRLAPSAP